MQYSPESIYANGITPEKGKLVLFSSGPENLHAVGHVGPTHPGGKPAASSYTLNLWLSPKKKALLASSREVREMLGEPAEAEAEGDR